MSDDTPHKEPVVGDLVLGVDLFGSAQVQVHAVVGDGNEL